MNDYQKTRFSTQIVKTMFSTVSAKKIAIWGFAFKKDTNDTRESAAIYVCRDLLEERAKLTIYDPQVGIEKIRKDVEYLMVGPNGTLNDTQRGLLDNNLQVAESAQAAADAAHAVVVMTEWDEFKTYDFEAIFEEMKKPAFVFDGRNILDAKKLSGFGFEVQSIGKSNRTALID